MLRVHRFFFFIFQLKVIRDKFSISFRISKIILCPPFKILVNLTDLGIFIQLYRMKIDCRHVYYAFFYNNYLGQFKRYTLVFLGNTQKQWSQPISDW